MIFTEDVTAAGVGGRQIDSLLEAIGRSNGNTLHSYFGTKACQFTITLRGSRGIERYGAMTRKR